MYFGSKFEILGIHPTNMCLYNLMDAVEDFIFNLAKVVGRI
jgi:hypothetical protein